MSVNVTSVFKDPDVANTLFNVHDKYDVVPADKAKNNIVILSAKRLHPIFIIRSRHRRQ